MSTNTQQPTIQQDEKSQDLRSMIPTVIYDDVSRIITTELVVSQPPGAGTITISASAITIPLGTWTVYWDLLMITAGLEAYFANPGIVLPKTLPPGATSLSGPTGTKARWTAQLENQVSTGASFEYDIVIESSAGTRKTQAQIKLSSERSRKDPIPVQDPVDPPKPHALG